MGAWSRRGEERRREERRGELREKKVITDERWDGV